MSGDPVLCVESSKVDFIAYQLWTLTTAALPRLAAPQGEVREFPGSVPLLIPRLTSTPKAPEGTVRLARRGFKHAAQTLFIVDNTLVSVF